jgi:EAL domain-containing protein (putative c-di-GMP-specific phosphodiesterase class I)
MYEAKRRQSHSWQLYREGSADATVERAEMHAALLDAIPAGQLRVLYQPIIALASGEMVAVEAQTRWQHPTRGLLLPTAYMPLAEETGLVQDVDLWLLEHACHQVRAWHDGVPQARSLRLSVYFSAALLARDTLAADVFAILHRTGFEPRRLVVEVTENVLVHDPTAEPRLDALRTAGVRVALQDVGADPSSLHSVTQLPVDILKLDRYFIAELDGSQEHSALAEAMLRLTQLLRTGTDHDMPLNAAAIEVMLRDCAPGRLTLRAPADYVSATQNSVDRTDVGRY